LPCFSIFLSNQNIHQKLGVILGVDFNTPDLKQSASEINADLLKYYTDIQEIFKEFEVIDVTPTPEQLRKSFNKRLKKDVSIEIQNS
jgi:hypothetical protein